VIDIQLLRIIKVREEYNKLAGLVPERALSPETKALMNDFGDYFGKYPTHKTIDWTVFVPRFQRRHPGMTPEKFKEYVAIIRNVIPDADEHTRAGILQEFHELALGTTAANIVASYEDGECENLLQSLTDAIDQYKFNSGIKVSSYIQDDIWDLLQDEINDAGVKWRLSCLNESMRPLRPGDFGIIAGRPDKGKTSFLTSEITCMAAQLPEKRNVVWLNNEGKGQRIKPRLYQSALDLSMSEMLKLGRDKLISGYIAAVGRLDRIRIFDIHGFHTSQVEMILENNNPGIIIYDMIDHIKGFGNEARNDLVLEEMYKWGRERSVKYDSIGLAASQISNEGDGMQFPTLGMLKDSKTGKQGACDFQLMIGASNDPGLTGSRFIGLPKNKLRREGAPGDPRAEVIFHGHKARYADLPAGA
jgi:replicative DNA helicase